MSIAEREESLGSFIAACLYAHGVRTVFGIPGTHNIEIYRGLAQYGISHVLTRHEQGAVYAADGYAKSSGRPGVVIATSGPGVTNCITGIANAYADSVPLLVISPGVPSGAERLELGLLHETKDQRSGINNFAEESIRAENREAVETAINNIFLHFEAGRRRAYHLEIPTDRIEQITSGTEPLPWRKPEVGPASKALHQTLSLIRNAERPLIVAGGGSHSAGEDLQRFAERYEVPVITTVQGKAAIDEEHRLSIGALAGGSQGFAPFARADVILALGTELRNSGLSAEAVVIRCDLDRKQLNKHVPATVPVLADTGDFLRQLLEIHTPELVAPRESWLKQLQGEATNSKNEALATWAVLHERVLTAARSDAGRGSVILTGDSSQVSWQGTVLAACMRGSERFITTDGYATLGYGLPAAIGAKIAKPATRVVSLLGDGALMFSIQELATASEQRLGLPVVVLDNGGYAEIEQNMLSAGIEPYAVSLKQPDYGALAKGFGCHAETATTPEELQSAVALAFERTAPTLIHLEMNNFMSQAWRQ